MRMTKCLICGGIYPEDEITFHLESSANHWSVVEERGLFGCFQYLEGSHEEENLESREWSDFPHGYEIRTPQDPMYPLLPYYGYIKRIGDKRNPKKWVYYCSLDGQDFQDGNEMLTHCLSEHPDHPETEGVLKERTKEMILHEIRVKKGSTQRISSEDLEKYASQVLKDQSIVKELTGKIDKHVFDGYIGEYYDRLFDFIQRKSDVCPLCSHSIDGMAVSEQEKYIANKVVNSLKAGMQNLSKEEEKDFNKLVSRTYEGKILDKKASLCLKCLLHLHTAHTITLRGLVAEKVLTGALPEYLALEKYKTESTRMTLSKVFDKPKSVEDSLTKGDKALRDWLKKK